jgi:hypothetical protein
MRKRTRCTPAQRATKEFMAVIPAMGEEKYGTQGKPILEKAGNPVRVYECLVCHLVELYQEEKSGEYP